MTCSNKLIFSSLFIFIAPLILASVYFYNISVRALEHSSLEHLQSVSAIYESKFNQSYNDFYYNVKLIVSDDEFLETLVAYSEDALPEQQTELSNRLMDFKVPLHSVNRISVLNDNGAVIASTDKAQIDKDYHEAGFFNPGSKEKIYVDYIDADDLANTISFSGPLKVNDLLKGVFYFEYDAAAIIAVDENYDGLGKTGEVLIAKRDKYNNAYIISPFRFDVEGEEQRIVNYANKKDPIIKALEKREGIYERESIDYRGKEVLAVTKYLDDVDWGMVVKMDKSEFIDKIIRLRIIFLLMILGVTWLMFFLSNFLSLSMTADLVKLLDGTRKIAKKGELNKIDIEACSEIGQIAANINIMVDALKENKIDLKKKTRKKK